jgi:gluconolactonase
MTVATAVDSAHRVPRPPEHLPGRPNAVVDLQNDEGAAVVNAEWRYADARVEEIAFVALGSPEDPLGPGLIPNRTYDVVPHAESADFDDSDWRVLKPAETMARLANGRVCFNWYRTTVTLPERIGDTEIAGATVVFEVVIDDYAEVWVNGRQPIALGDEGGQVAAGFNAPNRVILTRDGQPGDRFVIAVFGINGPISASPRNYIWMRSATLDVYSGQRARLGEPVELELHDRAPGIDSVIPLDARLERIATGFDFTEGPVWTRDGALLFSSPNTNVIYRWKEGRLSVFRTKSGYTGTDIGRYHQPGSNGLTFSPGDGLLTMCQHGNRRILRVNPHGDTTVLADSYEGRRLNSPNDLVYRSDGTLYFTDPPFGLAEPSDQEQRFNAVFRVTPGGTVTAEVTDLEGPNGLAFSPDEHWLYVGNWQDDRKIVARYPVAGDGSLGEGELFHDMTGAPGEDAIDGLKVDTAGNVYACGPGGVWILDRRGRLLGLLELPEAPHNLAFGEEDSRTLHITAETSVYRIRLQTPGIRPR